MEPSRIRELKEIYSQLEDDPLINIALNDDSEYEAEAVEIATNELNNRGITKKDIFNKNEKNSAAKEITNTNNEEPVQIEDSINSENISGPVSRITRFSQKEIADIHKILEVNDISHNILSVPAVDCHNRCSTQYEIDVSQNSFEKTISLLKDFFEIDVSMDMAQGYTGECPACGTHQENVDECVDCGLMLTGNPSEIFKNHAFIHYLKENNL